MKRVFIDPMTQRDVTRTLTPEKRYNFGELIQFATKSKATPYQSNYFVKTAAMTQSGKFVIGSNHEMALTETITHGEEAVIARALDNYGDQDKIVTIAFEGPTNEDGKAYIGSPCGNCRDSIEQYCDMDALVLLEGSSKKGPISYMPGNRFFFEDYETARKTPGNEAGFLQAKKGLHTAYDYLVPKEKQDQLYGAAILTEDGRIFRGSFKGDAAFHAVNPISAALCNLRDSADDPERINLKEVYVVGKKQKPKVLYKDRQHLLEMVEAMRIYKGDDPLEPIPITLYQLGGRNQVQKAWKTDSQEWLPHSFSAAAFGMDKKIKEGIEKLVK